MKTMGLDIGTKNIVLAHRGDNGKLKIRHEVNGFVKIPKSDGFTKQLLINSDVPYVERGDNFIALGKKAEELSYAFNRTLQRPMQDGVISGSEEEAMEIMAIIIHSILGDVSEDSVLYYCVPADAIDRNTNVAFHEKIIDMIMAQYDCEGVLNAYPINEARAIAIGETDDKTAISVSCGAGMVNVCYSLYGIEVFKFSLMGSGDKIDLDSAAKFGYDPDKPGANYKETPTSICRRKEGLVKDKPFSLSECPDDMVGKAIYINYGIMIERIVKGVVSGFKDNEEKARIDRPIPILIAGGTSSPDGFVEYFKKIIDQCDIPFDVGEVKRVDKPLYAVATGCLVAADMHGDDSE